MSELQGQINRFFRARDEAQSAPAFHQVWAHVQRRAAVTGRAGASGELRDRSAVAARPLQQARVWRWTAVPLGAACIVAAVYLFRGGAAAPDAAASLEDDMALASAMKPDAYFSSATDALIRDTRFRAPDVMPRTGFKDPFKESFL